MRHMKFLNVLGTFFVRNVDGTIKLYMCIYIIKRQVSCNKHRGKKTIEAGECERRR